MEPGKLLLLCMGLMFLMWYTLLWTLPFHVKADDDISDFIMETIHNGGDCLRKSKVDDKLIVSYVITIHGTDDVIESSANTRDPFVVHLGRFTDIPTLERGLHNMCELERRKIVVPASLGYGLADGYTKLGSFVPGNSTLQYDVTLIKLLNTDENNDGAGNKDKKRKKDKEDVQNMMKDAMKAMFTNKNAGQFAQQMMGVLGGAGGEAEGGMTGMMSQLQGLLGGANGAGMEGLMGQLGGLMGGGNGLEGLMKGLGGMMGGKDGKGVNLQDIAKAFASKEKKTEL